MMFKLKKIHKKNKSLHFKMMINLSKTLEIKTIITNKVRSSSRNRIQFKIILNLNQFTIKITLNCLQMKMYKLRVWLK